MSTFVLALGDMHSGHKLGLCNPDVEIEDVDEEGKFVTRKLALTHTQIYLWGRYTEHIKRAKKSIGKSPVVVFHGGDPTHGDTYPEQLLVRRSADQVAIAVSNLSYLVSKFNVRSLRLVAGTSVHSISEYSSDVEIQKELAREFPRANVQNVLHSLATVEGVRFDVAHHGPGTGIRQWTRGNVARYYLKSLVNQEISDGNRPPDVVLRFHRHDLVHEAIDVWWKGELMVVHIFVVPSYCGLNHYARKTGQSPHRLTNGMILFETNKGKLISWKPLIDVLDLRAKETL